MIAVPTPSDRKTELPHTYPYNSMSRVEAFELTYVICHVSTGSCIEFPFRKGVRGEISERSCSRRDRRRLYGDHCLELFVCQCLAVLLILSDWQCTLCTWSRPLFTIIKHKSCLTAYGSTIWSSKMVEHPSRYRHMKHPSARKINSVFSTSEASPDGDTAWVSWRSGISDWCRGRGRFRSLSRGRRRNNRSGNECTSLNYPFFPQVEPPLWS